MVVRRSQSQREQERERRFGERTLEVWRKRCQRDLTCEDLRQITENTVGFFQILLEWETKEKSFQGKNLKKTS